MGAKELRGEEEGERKTNTTDHWRARRCLILSRFTRPKSWRARERGGLGQDASWCLRRLSQTAERTSAPVESPA
eukprot:scaffold1220_cov117-Isochrysis_galbana.AAC.2